MATGLFALPFAVSAASFHDHLGLQLWSLRAQTKESTTGALDQAKAYGFTEIETAGTGDLTVEKFAAELKARGLKAVSAHIGYDQFNKDTAAAIRDAKTLGASFVMIAWIPHDGPFTVETAHQVAANFNKWGEACKAAGLRFGYHPHGFEFHAATPGGELPFDVLLRETKPEFVTFEMDVFWVYHAGQDPAKLLLQHPDRWSLLHVKDIRKGAVTGLSTGSAPPTDNVAVGDGQINWPEVLRAAEKIGVKHYFIEDETPTPLQCIPASLKYLKALKL